MLSIWPSPKFCPVGTGLQHEFAILPSPVSQFHNKHRDYTLFYLKRQ